jgi:hypothetical protein
VEIAYEEERKRVEEEWKRGRDRVRERLVEGVEERRRRAREEKEGEGTIGCMLSPHSLIHSFTVVAHTHGKPYLFLLHPLIPQLLQSI